MCHWNNNHQYWNINPKPMIMIGGEVSNLMCQWNIKNEADGCDTDMLCKCHPDTQEHNYKQNMFLELSARSDR